VLSPLEQIQKIGSIRCRGDRFGFVVRLQELKRHRVRSASNNHRESSQNIASMERIQETSGEFSIGKSVRYRTVAQVERLREVIAE
jgi:hypothetical protein